MMKKSLADKLKQTTTAQRQDNKDRFKSADDLLLRGIAGPAGEKKPAGLPLPEDDKAPLVRAGFLIPEAEHAIIQATLQRLAMAGITSSKTEVVRMALKALEKQSDKQLKALSDGLEPVRKGRPATV